MSKDSLKDLSNRMKVFEKECQNTGEKLVFEHFKDVFEKHPELKSFGWKQYANYYCDGGPCNFYVRSEDLTINGNDYNDYDDDFPEDLVDVSTAVTIVLNDIDNHILKMIFGPDQHVIIHRNGKIDNNDFSEHD